MWVVAIARVLLFISNSIRPDSVATLPSFLKPLLSLQLSVTMVSVVTAKYDWIFAITTIAFIFSAFGNGANDVANSYASML